MDGFQNNLIGTNDARDSKYLIDQKSSKKHFESEESEVAWNFSQMKHENIKATLNRDYVDEQA